MTRGPYFWKPLKKDDEKLSMEPNLTIIIRSQEKNSNLSRDSNLVPPDF